MLTIRTWNTCRINRCATKIMISEAKKIQYLDVNSKNY